MGMCCPYAYLVTQDLKASRSADGNLKPSHLVHNLGFLRTTAHSIVERYRRKEIVCENKRTCLLAKAGWQNTEPPTFTKEHMAWLRLKDQRVEFWRMEVGEEAVYRHPVPPFIGHIIGLAHTDWLYFTATCGLIPNDLCLGDSLCAQFPEDKTSMVGTVIEINGPTLVLLLPGKHHGQRNKQVKNG